MYRIIIVDDNALNMQKTYKEEEVCVMEYHVAIQGSDQAPGTAEQPFRSISRAAALAVPGDIITVHAGI